MRGLVTILVLPLLVSAQEPRKLDKLCEPGDQEFFGLTCSEDDPCPLYLELVGIESSGSAVFVAGNLHTVSTTLFGVLLISPDQGKTWLRADNRFRALALEQIQFVDREHGWVSGGTLEPLPKDPFLLSTADGGKTWNQLPVFEETHFGAIAQFWFSSVTDGELVIDSSQGAAKHFERYETQDSGAKWERKDTVDHEIQLAQAAGHVPSNWRVRIEGDTYAIESRASGDWEPVTKFAVNAGECK